LAGFLVHHRQNPCNGFADGVAGNDALKWAGSEHVHNETHILVSLDAEPPAIFCTRRVSSSFLSSTSCFDKSFFDLNTQSEAPRCGRGCSALGLELVGLDFSGHLDGGLARELDRAFGRASEITLTSSLELYKGDLRSNFTIKVARAIL
jgi:hypothetical protein